MPTARKNVKKYLIVVFYVVLFLAISVAVLPLLPGPLALGLFLFVAEFKTQIAKIALCAFLAFFAYKYYKFIKRTASPAQAIKENLKRWIIRLLSISFVIYACLSLLVSILPDAYDRCDYYTEELNGGLKEYQGQKFMVKLCGEDRHHGWFSDGNDEIWLEVLNEKGDLLAKRTFFVHWDVYYNRKIEYHPDHLSYIDDSSDKIKKLSMPPTILDWIRARIPLLD
jgi:hypothetical protein